MRVSKKSSKRVLSFIMALAVALTMCIGFMPQKVLAAAENFQALKDGRVVTSGNISYDDLCISGGFLAPVDDVSKIVSWDATTKTLTITDGSFDDISGDISGITIVVNGNCSTRLIGAVDKDNGNVSTGITIQMNPGAKLTIDQAYGKNKTTEAAAYKEAINTYVTIKGGKLADDGSIVSTESAEVKKDDELQEKGKTSADSATYKVTGTDEGKRSVTYEKPAENASGTEEIKASVILKDGNEYKVTAIGDGAFKNFEKKDDIAKIIIGDNVEEIGKNACEGLKNVKEVKIGKNVKKIGAKAFKGCVALTKCDVPDNVEEIGESANEGCKKLTKLTIGKKVKKIGKKAYYQSGLKNIKVKSSKLTKASKIGKNAFGKINKKAKVKMKMTKSEARKAKAPTIKVFKNKKIGYVKTWSVS
ncbi:leucine-rich repeat domain-containing protein [Butyrivibrio sp. MB2005]|uniref:leucine-rich repeat domain-containing protein n=1 Tax=Butyrivibrio sp. MB2005 TaxID=1280678 RepID=UPI00040DD400|nr:leucine-rich repeat domain-containing protein [Butyrivibrio sp. MB2005]